MNELLQTLGAMALCFLGVGIISAMETALVGLPTARVHACIDAKVRGARSLLFWLQRPGQVLGSLHLLRSLLTLCLGVVVWLAAARHGLAPLATAALGLVTILGLTGSHLLLRTVAKRYPVEVATHSMWLVMACTLVLVPLVAPLALFGRTVARLLKVSAEQATPFWTPDEIGRLTTDAHAASLGARGEDLFLSIIEFSDTVIREIMVPRTEMVVVPRQASRREVQQVVLDAGHSRIPIYDDTIDTIVGVLHVKDLFIAQIRAEVKQQERPFVLEQMLRPTFYVPEVMKISELLREFQRRKTHLAIVVDEYGGTAGVVTLEDILEEIVGEIHDEYDVEEKQFRVLGDKILADGRVSIWDIEEALGISFPDDADYETLAGFLMSRSGTLPKTGSAIQWGAFRFLVKEANEKRIGMVEIERLPAAKGTKGR